MKSDLEIARTATLRPIEEIGGEAGLLAEEIEPYGRHMAKVSLDAIGRLADRPQARYVVVSAITPTPLGEGKTVHTIGLSLALSRLAAGAGFLYPLVGTMRRMPGLGSKPALEHVDLDENGEIVGLF